MNRLLLISGLLVGLPLWGWAAVETAAPIPTCSPAREFITFIEYMRSKAEWRVPEKNRRDLARTVALHCPGSAARVIRVTSLLSESGVGSKDALSTGIRFASVSEEIADRFLILFKKLYLQSELDLDVRTSHRVATDLTVDFAGTLPALEKEFVQLVEFCGEDAGLGQSRPQCARMAAELLSAAQDQGSGVAGRFRMLYEFLTRSTQGPSMSPQQGLILSQQICGASEKGPESFVEGYRYALSKKGLGQSVADSVEFAKDLVLQQIATSKLKTSSEVQAPEKQKPEKS